MLTRFTKWIGSKIAMSYLKKIVHTNKDKIVFWCAKIAFWIDKLERAIELLKKLRLRLADGVLTNKEIKDTLADAKQLSDDIKA